jgi:hypothetical protein
MENRGNAGAEGSSSSIVFILISWYWPSWLVVLKSTCMTII